jgi:hypothetical protein
MILYDISETNILEYNVYTKKNILKAIARTHQYIFFIFKNLFKYIIE